MLCLGCVVDEGVVVDVHMQWGSREGPDRIERQEEPKQCQHPYETLASSRRFEEPNGQRYPHLQQPLGIQGKRHLGHRKGSGADEMLHAKPHKSLGKLMQAEKERQGGEDHFTGLAHFHERQDPDEDDGP